jgi:ABC-type transport system involved in multi-copper enzyme maturation permease subunit
MAALMSFLPIVERELRVASRRKSTYRIRLWTTLAGLLVSFLFMFSASLVGNFIPGMGRILYTLLTYYTFGLSLLAGVFLAADCLSEEKRDGTLGLLFLTDLKGHDVVLGKLTAVGLSALYGLVAVLPVTALPLLMGGVAGNEYWRVSLALANALFFALAAGILVSAWSRESVKAMSNTFVLLLVAVVVLPAIGAVFNALGYSAGWYFTSFSPFYPFAFGAESAFVYDPKQYWISLAASNFFAWFLLVLAGWTLPRNWQDKPVRASSRPFRLPLSALPAYSFLRSGRRRQLLDINPVLWLAESGGTSAGRAMGWRAWFVAIVGAGVIFATSLTGNIYFRQTMGSATWVFVGLLKLLIAVQACRFFAEARRNGALELLLSTPLTSAEIIRGQWAALKQFIFWPAVVLIVGQLLSLAVQMAIFNKTSTGFQGAYGGTVGLFGGQLPYWALVIFSVLYRIAVFIADYFALGWMGMWLALSLKKPNLAAPLTILYVLVLPRFAFCVPDIIIDVFFITWARGKLQKDIRSAAIPHYRPSFTIPQIPRPPQPPAAPPPLPAQITR